ncbi:MAG: flavodoxin domain-containing protein [Bacillota bacterium]
MAKVLVLFHSYDGQTRRIAGRIAATLAARGHRVDARSATDPEALATVHAVDAVVVGSAVRIGRHARLLERALGAAAQAIGARPNAFFSVCLSVVGPRPRPDLIAEANEKLFARSRWTPQQVANFAGALLYRKYPWPLRLMMRFIVGRAGGDIDTSRDYEYTDWNAVDRFAAEFAGRLSAT